VRKENFSHGNYTPVKDGWRMLRIRLGGRLVLFKPLGRHTKNAPLWLFRFAIFGSCSCRATIKLRRVGNGRERWAPCQTVLAYFPKNQLAHCQP